MCFCVSRIVCVCLLVGCMLKCGCCSKHNHNATHLRTDKKDSVLKDELIFLKEIFLKYGTNDSLTFEGLQLLLKSLGLDRVVTGKDSQDVIFYPLPHADHELESSTDGEKRSNALLSNGTALNNGSSLEELQIPEEHSESNLKCRSATALWLSSHEEKILNSTSFLSLCPAIIYDLEQGNCMEKKQDYHNHSSQDVTESTALTTEVWLFASLAVLVISLCGLLSVALVPLMQRVFYQYVLQFLVGLAVGSLSGDALLHLLPHAMASLSHHDHDGSSHHVNDHEPNEHRDHQGSHAESQMHMWRGLVALVGIYAFYLAERLLTRVSSCYRTKNKGMKDSLQSSVTRREKAQRSSQQSMHQLDPIQSRTVGEKLSHHKHGSYGFKFDEIEMEDLQKLNDGGQDDSTTKAEFVTSSDTETNNEKEMALLEPTGEPSSDNQKDSVNVLCASPKRSLDQNETLVINKNGSDYVVASGHHHHHHHHSHHHHHISSSSISTVAWMVIMGDGMHNFCDGLALGAAFAAGLSSGLSTTIAVFCHELPHELGDFAMLLKAGMSVKQALTYNALSSILCFLGMIVGVLLGNVGAATLWIFAGTAGMFLYIALVDMLPELTAQEDEDKATFPNLFLQACGIIIGIIIMLLIAFYEHDLRHLIK